MVLGLPYNPGGEAPRGGPLHEVVVEWLTNGGFIAGVPTDHPSTIKRFLEEGGSLFYKFPHPSAQQPPRVRVFARPAEEVFFGGVPIAPGAHANPSVDVR